MRTLAIDTATSSGSVALLEGGVLVAEVTESVPMRHLEWLTPTIERVLGEVGWRPEAIEGLAVSKGPGGFTGLRIGIATAGAWAKARRIPVVGVPTLAAVALGADAHGLVCPLLDIRRGEVAAALFERDEGITRVMADLLAPLEVVLAALPADGVLTFVGDGLERYGSAVRVAYGGRASLAPRDQWAPRASAVGRLAWERLARGDGDDPYTLLPIYAHQPVLREGQWPSANQGGDRRSLERN